MTLVKNRGRQLLMLASEYPPTPRVLKLAKHLPELGWTPHLVVPAADLRGDGRFSSAELPAAATVDRTPYLPALSSLLSRRKRTERVSPTRPREDGPARQPAAQDLARSALMWLNTPDEWVGWLPFAIWRGRRLVRNTGVRAIYASGPPFTTVLAGALLKRLTGVPYVADFRDAWSLDASDPFGAIGGVFRAPYGRPRVGALRRLEAFCVSVADRVLFTSKTTRTRYCEHYAGLHRRSLVVFNGVDEEDFSVAAATGEAFTFTYVGSLHPYQLAGFDLFAAALRLASGISREAAKARLLVAGFRSEAVDSHLRAAVREAGLQEKTELRGPVTHSEAVALMKGAGTILLFAGENAFIRLMKISDGAAAGRPLLALARADSETGRHVADLGHRVFSGDAPEQLAEELVRLAGQGYTEPTGAFPFPYPHPLNWRTAASLVAQAMNALCGDEGPSADLAGRGPRDMTSK